jgi:hypothetical protein
VELCAPSVELCVTFLRTYTERHGECREGHREEFVKKLSIILIFHKYVLVLIKI